MAEVSKRDRPVQILMTAQEFEQMSQKMEEMGIKSISAYLRKMALDGYCVNLNLEDVRDMVRLLRYYNNNLNQYAKRANETGSIYLEDIQDLQRQMKGLWEMEKEILGRLASI